MAKQNIPESGSSSDLSEDLSLTETLANQQYETLKPFENQTDSIKHYVSNVLRNHRRDHQEEIDLETIEIETSSQSTKDKKISAFHHYHSNIDETTRVNAQQQSSTLSTDDETNSKRNSSVEQIEDHDEFGRELNLDPNPIVEQRQSETQIYKQKVYLRQLQPPTPQPIEIQVKEVLLRPPKAKSPLEVRVGLREPRTPSPIVIKSNPPHPPQNPTDQPIVYNKYVPPPKQPPQQIIIHRHPDLPPKPRPIIIEQWLPYKPAPKRIIKESLPAEARQTPVTPHNLIVSYSKPRALIQVELVRLPVVKIDPETYQRMSTAGEQSIHQQTSFSPEQEFFSREDSQQPTQTMNQFNWRI